VSNDYHAAMSGYDAFLVPGGGLREDGEIPPWVRVRLDRALELRTAEYLIPLSAGTVHKPPPLDAERFPILESIAARTYLVEHGMPADRILPETCSYDTIGNAYFSRVVHVDPAGFRRLLVITSDFHMARTEIIFRWVYGLPPTGYTLDFETVPDVGIGREALDARIQREATSLEQLRTIIPRIGTLRRLHRWLYTDHGAYAAGGSGRVANDAVNTY
jgi:uncharacterized SAM-binding protein YcdF (DUF218 family)